MDPEYDIMAEQSSKQSAVQLREKKSRKKVSDAWAHFTRCDGPRAACNYCVKTYACHPVKNGTTNMIRKKLLKEKRERKRLGGKSEVEVYLADPSEDACNDKFDILSWWKNNCTKYPILSLIAKDVLAIPVLTVASKSAFSTGGLILDPLRSSLTPQMVEALIYSQNWLRSSIGSNEEVHVNIDDSCIQDLELYQIVQSELEKSALTSLDLSTLEIGSF